MNHLEAENVLNIARVNRPQTIGETRTVILYWPGDAEYRDVGRAPCRMPRQESRDRIGDCRIISDLSVRDGPNLAAIQKREARIGAADVR